MEETNNKDVIFGIDIVINMLETATNVKFKLVNEFDKEYISLGQISEQQLLDVGFEFTGYSSYVKCPVYQLGKNIEAVFNETILHIYDLRG